MKTNKLKLFRNLVGSAAFIASLTTLNALASILAGWDVNGLANSGPSPFTVTSSDPSLTVGGLTKGSGIVGTTTANVWGGNAWNTTSEALAIAGNHFFTFTIKPNAGYTLSVTNISKFFVTKSATGPATGAFQWSTNGTTFADATALAYGVQGTALSAASVGTVDLSGIAGLQNVNSNITVTIRIICWGATSSGGTWYIGNGASGSDFEVSGTPTLLPTGTPPSITSILPSSITTNAGSTAAFTVTATGDTASNYWYKVVGSTTNLIPTATLATLTLGNVLMADTANYFVILSNSVGKATSSVVSLVVTGDPTLITQPTSQLGLLKGKAQFSVGAVGTALNYQWYYCSDPNDATMITSAVSNGTRPSGAVVFGASSNTLLITNLTALDSTNFVLIATGTYGSLTSSVVTLTVTNTGPLAFWNFNGTFDLNNPAPYQGSGTASLVNCHSFLQVSSDGLDVSGGGANTAWGTDTYPTATLLNTNAGVRFNVSTVGAKNITVSFDTRATSTASKYQQLQYTTNGTDFVNYPVSTAFTGAGYVTRFFNLAGFPGVANNPNFGIRIVAEFESTASYGATNDAQYVGVSSTYSSSGTISFDVVTVSGDAITNAFAPPTVTAIANTATVDDTPVTTSSFTVSGNGPLQLSATSANQAVLTDSAFTFGTSGANSNLTIIPQIADGIVPVLVSATDVSGDIRTIWFYLTINPANFPPTITALMPTNLLANTSLTIPFVVGDDRTALANLDFSTNSGNTLLIPNANISLGGSGANRTVTVTPAANMVGVAPISVTVFDKDATSQPKSTTTTFTVMVLPNTNVLFIDNFDYDMGGPIISQSGGLWATHSGTAGQLAVGGGVATVSQTLTEDVNAKLIGQPYKTNSGTVLYSSFVANFSALPTMPGQYVEHLLDLASIGSGASTAYGARVWASISNAAPGLFRLGIINGSGGTNTSGQVALDLGLNTNYTVVTRFVLTNGSATIWINPSSESSPGVTATDLALLPSAVDNPINVTSVALRQNTEQGILTVDDLRVGLTFDSVLPAPHIQQAGTKIVVKWSDPSLYLKSAAVVTGPYDDVFGAVSPYTNNVSGPMIFFRLTNQPPSLPNN